ncbi:MAG: PDZ domain-containing protein [Planctomycetes bacterium]|nr:PDZ domain-containing protein [Planctomycetota bacterium]
MNKLAPAILLLAVLCALSLQAPQAQDAGVSTFEDFAKLEKTVQELATKLRPAVVGVRMSNSSGSGSFISADGWIATCAHVCEVKPDVKCRIIAYGGEEFEGTVYGTDMAMDFGLIKADTKGKKVPFVELGDSDKVKNGQWLISMGHPLGVEKGRDAVVRCGRVLLSKNRQGFITMDTPVIHGDSGGPTFDLSGKQVGINQSIHGMDARINNATPVAMFKLELDEMKQKKCLHPVRGQPRFGRGVQSDGLTDEEREAYGKAMEAHGGKNFEQAEKLVQPFASKKGLDEGVLYNLACIYSMLSTKQKGAQADASQKKAVELFKASVEAGWDDIDHVRKDSDLDCLRQRKDYLAVEDLCAKAKVKPMLGLSVRVSSGVRVSEVIPGSPADKAGLRKDDIIQKIGKKKIAGAQDYVDALLFEGLSEAAVSVSRKKEKAPEIKLTLPPLGIKVISSGGAQVCEVAEDSLGYKAGLKVNDVITKVGSVKVKTTIDFANALFTSDARTPIQLSVKRGYTVETVPLEMGGSDTGGAATSVFKQSDNLLKLWEKITAKHQDAVFSVKQKGKQATFATAVHAKGYLICKASELIEGEKITLVGRSGTPMEATLVAQDPRTDIALLKAASTLVSVVRFDAQEFPAVGSLVGTLDEKGKVVGYGFVALPPYDTDQNARPLPNDAVMGVGVEDAPGGVKVTAVTAGQPAEKGGLKVGDIIVKIDGAAMASRDAFMAFMRGQVPGAVVEIEIKRGEAGQKLKVTLGARKDMPGGGGAGPEQKPQGTGKPDLGVAAGEPAETGLKVSAVRDGSAADLAGIGDGDIILEADDKPISSMDELNAAVNAHKIGDKMKLKLLRGGKPLTLEVEIAEMEAPPNPNDAQHKGPINIRCDRFGACIQHDALLTPRQMGGPIIDIKGNIVGFNLARSDRTRNFALPATRVAEVINKLMPQGETDTK